MRISTLAAPASRCVADVYFMTGGAPWKHAEVSNAYKLYTTITTAAYERSKTAPEEPECGRLCSSQGLHTWQVQG
jgi:hypothetical protein